MTGQAMRGARHWPASARARLARWLSIAPPNPNGAGGLAVEDVNGSAIIVLPTVFNGIRFFTGAFLAESLTPDVVPAGGAVLDLGTGSGVGAVFAARLATRVVAIDINPEAVRCATINALAHHLEDRIEVRCGDLFAPVRGERFDLVLFNPPYFRGVAQDAADHALRSPDTFERFLSALPEYLTPRGRALVVLSPDTDIESALWAADHLTLSVFRARDVLNKTLRIFALRPKDAADAT